MKTYKTRNAVTINDKRNQPIGDYILHMRIESITILEDYVRVSGFYYYIDNLGKLKQLDVIDFFRTWDTIAMGETLLEPITGLNFKDAIERRLNEFTHLQLVQEAGSNYGTTVGDWIIFDEDE